jgi:hypothetical protein
MSLLDVIRGWFHKPQPEPPAAPSPVSAGKTGPPANIQTTTPSNQRFVLLIHGYSASGTDFLPWKKALEAANIPAAIVDVGNYVTLNNEVTIKDLGEAFDRALRLNKFPGVPRGDNWSFDAIVHSTGMLVLRQWLTSDPHPGDQVRSRVRRLKHLVGLAPATFGSPQAKKGRSWLGTLVKGNKNLGPDFMNAGDEVLDGLELASEYTWDLAHKDMICATPFYDKGDTTPYVAIFIGNEAYEGIAAVSNSPGSDGTVRWAGCALNARKVSLDFRRFPKLVPNDPTKRCDITDWSNARLAAPIIAVEKKNHGTIISAPDPVVVGLIKDFLTLADETSYEAWETKALAAGAGPQRVMNTAGHDDSGGAGWQQLVIHMVDERGDGVSDYNFQLFCGDDLAQSDDPEFAPVRLIVDTYSSDSSYRCFYVPLTDEMLKLKANGKKMWVELIASSGSSLIEYEAYTGGENDPPQRLAIDAHSGMNQMPVKMDITALTGGSGSLFYPYTTTLLEVFVEREPMPLGAVSGLFTFPPYSSEVES